MAFARRATEEGAGGKYEVLGGCRFLEHRVTVIHDIGDEVHAEAEALRIVEGQRPQRAVRAAVAGKEAEMAIERAVPRQPGGQECGKEVRFGQLDDPFVGAVYRSTSDP